MWGYVAGYVFKASTKVVFLEATCIEKEKKYIAYEPIFPNNNVHCTCTRKAEKNKNSANYLKNDQSLNAKIRWSNTFRQNWA